MTTRVLLANPNTTQAVTDLAAARARAVAAPGTEIVPVTARFGARVIGTRSELAIAEHAALDVIAREAAGCDAVVVAASTDSGVKAARELLPVPVLGLTEAALHTACLIGSTFATVTLSARSNATLRDQVLASGLMARCVALRAVDATPRDLLADPDAVAARVAAAARALVGEGADCIVLIGAVMAGIADRMDCDVPVLEGVSCAVALIEALLRLRLPKPVAGGYAAPAARETIGLDPLLAARLKGVPWP
jgi:allantoin racemase